MAKKTPKKPNETKPSETQPTISTPNPPEPVSAIAVSAAETAATKSPAENTQAKINTTKKPEIVAASSRSNLVPINLDDEIRRLAYLLSERRGFQPGHENEDWLSAERQVLQRYHQTSA